MIYFLLFLLSWLCGMLAILIGALFSYDQFSLIDITSFAAITFAGFLVIFLLIYLFVLKLIKGITGNRQFIFLPLIFSLLANLPVYFFTWINVGNYYGKGEATLFTLGFFTSGFAFGLCWAWKTCVLASPKTM